MDPPKVFFDEDENKYLVVDGNHRLSALKQLVRECEVTNDYFRADFAKQIPFR